jgi:hypothetical protein
VEFCQLWWSCSLFYLSKDGSSKEFHVNGIGLISSRILVEGPIVKDKGAFFNWRTQFICPSIFKIIRTKNNAAYFYDLNTKINYKFDANSVTYGYFGRDVFSLNNSFTNI